jgi:hypothetical protein
MLALTQVERTILGVLATYQKGPESSDAKL